MKRPVALSVASLTVLIAILACSLPGVGSTPTPSDFDIVETSVAATLAAQPTLPLELPPTDTPNPTPTTSIPTPLPSATSAVGYDQGSGAYRIRFAQGGTWADVKSRTQSSQPVRFVAGAAKGQVMSVSVREGWGYTLEIVGADGTKLKSPDDGRSFWRGTLPATQDYFITVTAGLDSDFMLRVAINPPGKPVQTFDFYSGQDQLTVSYPDLLAPVNFPYNDQLRAAPALALQLVDTSFYDNTNLVEAYFVLTILRDPQMVSTCSQPFYPQETAQGQETINGLVFDKSTAGGVGAGNIYEQTIYRAVQKNNCYEALFFVHYGNIGNYTPGTVKEFDKDALIKQFHAALETFTLK
jgi:hypothetical protein